MRGERCVLLLLFLIDVCVVVGGGVIPFLSQAKIWQKKTFPT